VVVGLVMGLVKVTVVLGLEKVWAVDVMAGVEAEVKGQGVVGLQVVEAREVEHLQRWSDQG
jgi:uncharacterized protein affecting Mg2+/Co2+ transport